MVRPEDIGPVILEQVKQWLQHANVVLKPVINLPGLPPVDHYETPPAMSEAIGLHQVRRLVALRHLHVPTPGQRTHHPLCTR